MNQSTRSDGFTLIEIVLVLAIAGLLLVIVFLAVSGAQRARRDFERKNDVSTFLSAGLKYASDHRGNSANTVSEIETVKTQYFDSRKDPKLGIPYFINFREVGTSHHDDPGGIQVGTIDYQAGHWCNNGEDKDPDPDAVIAGDDTSLFRFAVWTKLEAGGIICADSR